MNNSRLLFMACILWQRCHICEIHSECFRLNSLKKDISDFFHIVNINETTILFISRMTLILLCIVHFITARCICISAVYAVTRCPSVTFVSCAKTNKDIFDIFSPSGSHTILVFLYQMGWRCSDGNPHNGGVECKGV